jgi:cytidylate kinase
VGSRGPVIAIDGPSGAGKTTVSRLVSQRLNFRYVDTGAMYRAVALAASEAGIDIESDEELERFLKGLDIRFGKNDEILLNNRDFSRRIRGPKAGPLASRVSRKRPVREFCVFLQRRLGEKGNVVMEGRDIGTVVFPDADVKIFLDASTEMRAGRRHRELAETGKVETARLEDVAREIKERDLRDSRRALSPLKMADDAVYLDTSEQPVEAVVERILHIVKEKQSGVK